MQFTRLKLTNWRNFTSVDLAMTERLFVTGPNASGKSNLLDVFRFLRDLAQSGGGLQQAVLQRGGLAKVRCLAARRDPKVGLEVELKDGNGADATTWRYSIGIRQESRGLRQVQLTHERVWKNNEQILNRPDEQDRMDALRLTETHLEQISANREFRPLAEAFQKVLYLHLVPQFLKFPHLVKPDAADEDPFGIRFLNRLMATPERTRRSRLRKIEKALQSLIPELESLTEVSSERGFLHLAAAFKHWRPNAGKQLEDQFSDGTLRLIGLLWTLLDGDSLLLLEEPELSLHTSIVAKLPEMIWKLQRTRNRQVFTSSHSSELFSDRGISPEEVALLVPHGSEGTEVKLASDMEDISLLLEGGMTMAEAVLPMTAPASIAQLSRFD